MKSWNHDKRRRKPTADLRQITTVLSSNLIDRLLNTYPSRQEEAEKIFRTLRWQLNVGTKKVPKENSSQLCVNANLLSFDRETVALVV